MAVIDVNKLKVGVSFSDNGQIWQVLKYDFSKMGRGKANIKVKVKSLSSGTIVTKGFQSGNVVERVDLTKKQLQYLYADGVNLYFMDPQTFEQIEVDKKVVGENINYLVEGEKVWVLSFEDKVLGVELPASVVMKIKQTGSAEKGNSATNVLKEAVMENGLKVHVPMFIKTGDKIKINTSTGEYVARQSS